MEVRKRGCRKAGGRFDVGPICHKCPIPLILRWRWPSFLERSSIAGEDYPVAPLMLGSVERLVRTLHQLCFVGDAELGRGDAERSSYCRYRLAGLLRRPCGDGKPDPFSYYACRGG